MRLIQSIIIIIITTALLGCGSSKEELNMENETPESMLQRSANAYQSGNYEESVQLAQLLIDHFPTSDLHIDAQLLIARDLGALEEYEQQFDLLLRILKENIIPEKVPSIYAQIAAFYENAARWNPGTVNTDSVDFQKAAEFYRKAVFYPNSEDNATKAMALYRMALTYAKLDDIETASKAYEEVITTYPSSPYSTLARTKLTNPANTEELPLPTPAETQVAGGEAAAAAPGVQPEVASPPEKTIEEKAPGQIELPAEETGEEPSIIDSLQTIDQDDNPLPKEE
jgi:tetratricopeptide (TPR) repeat protein